MISSIIHSTSFEAYEGIIIAGKILDQKDREKILIYLIGEGTHNRKVGPIDYFLNPEKKDEKFDEGMGVYFRIETTIPLDFAKLPGNVHFVFTDNLLKQYPDWLINSTENFGFQINHHGKGGFSQMTGEFGTSWVRTITKDGVKNLNENSELLIMNSVDLKNLKMVVFKSRDHFMKSKTGFLPYVKYVVVQE